MLSSSNYNYYCLSSKRHGTIKHFLPEQLLQHHIQQSYIHLLCYNYNITTIHQNQQNTAGVQSYHVVSDTNICRHGTVIVQMKYGNGLFLWYFNERFIHKIKLIWVEIKNRTTYNIYIHSKSCSLTLCSPNPDLHSLSSPLQYYNGLNPDKSWQLFLTNPE